ncbi:hypothetical protein HLM50_17460 [Sulfitobacter sp. Ks41]|uniref:hypothetical protein n=1 Tax=Sulfitobacter sp. Ks41 TaxID=2731139 RepID=UPI0023E296C3|nr:hypothetical protein [Sulfitobacter sp. Ks41]MDF3362839.1 hypothetical protein [Sulfitobacter sp. Ks41]
MRQPVEGDMAKTPSENDSAALPSHEVLPVRAYLDINEVDLETQKMNEIAQLVRLPDSLSKAEQNARLARALDLYESLAPTDGLEGMLAAQMVGTHHAALDCLRMAAVPGQTFASRDMNLKHAQKLMALYTQQMAALNKHRGKGQQKVTVEHVNVHAGGQAVVGNVEMGKRNGKTSSKTDAIRDVQNASTSTAKRQRKPTKSKRRD